MLNHFITSLNRQDREQLFQHLEPFDLPKAFVMLEANTFDPFTYFPETGIGAINAVSGAYEVTVSLFGAEGMSSTTHLFGSAQAPFRTVMVVAGHGHRIKNQHLSEVISSSEALRNRLSRYAQAIFVQISQTALSNAVHMIEKRLARWLLMIHDRTSGDSFAVTHEGLAALLHVRRQSITGALHELEGDYLIASRRGTITIVDRQRLVAYAGDAYGISESEATRLMKVT